MTDFKRVDDKSDRFFTLSLDLLCIAGFDGYFKRLNPAFETILGYSTEVLSSKPFIEFVHPEDREITRLELEKLATGKPTFRFENRYRTKDGNYKWLEWMAKPFLEEKCIYAVARDISEHKLAEEELRQRKEELRASQERLNSILSSLDAVVWSIDLETWQTIYINTTAEKVYGRSLKEFYQDSNLTLQLICPCGGKALDEVKQKILATGELDSEYQIVRPDRSIRWVHVRCRVVGNKQDKSIRLDGVTTDITNRKYSEEALKESEERFRQIAENLREVFFTISAETGKMLYISPAYEEVWGRSCESLYQNIETWFEAIHPEDYAQAMTTLETQFRTGQEFEEEYRIIRPDGTSRWVSVHAFPVENQEGKIERFVGIAEDITKRQEAEEAVRKSEEQFRLTFELAPIGMAITNLEGKFEQVNHSLCEALGYTASELQQCSFMDISHPDELDANLALHQKLLQGQIDQFKTEQRYLAKNGEIVHAILQAVMVRDSQGQPLHILQQVVNISDRKRVEEQLLHDAFHDSLTGLPNRPLFMERLAEAMKRSKGDPNYLFALLFLDLDRFKLINDTAGHLVGDKLLIAIAQKLENCLRQTDTVARLGGDEFTILLERIHAPDYATNVAERIHQSLKQPFNIEGQEIFTSASIGITIGSPGYEKPEDFLRDADIAMYRAKDSGRARHEIFDSKMHSQILDRLEIENDLRRAIEREEFLVYYQPILALKTEKITGFEALMRWNHPDKGLISPVQFIPIAEETGLIVPMGEWVFQEACSQMFAWQSQFPNLEPLTITINLSGKQFREPNLLQKITEIIDRTGLEPKWVKLEITESMLMHNVDAVTLILCQLREMQIQLSIDDFGTGYSSLSYLQRFPVNTLKIDRCFIKQIEDNGGKSEIVEAIINLAHTLNMDVTAEGIETPRQLEQLKLLGCEQGQGFLFSKPVDKRSAAELLSRLGVQ